MNEPSYERLKFPKLCPASLIDSILLCAVEAKGAATRSAISCLRPCVDNENCIATVLVLFVCDDPDPTPNPSPGGRRGRCCTAEVPRRDAGRYALGNGPSTSDVRISIDDGQIETALSERAKGELSLGTISHCVTVLFRPLFAVRFACLNRNMLTHYRVPHNLQQPPTYVFPHFTPPVWFGLLPATRWKRPVILLIHTRIALARGSRPLSRILDPLLSPLQINESVDQQ